MTLFPFSFALFTIADTSNSLDDINEEKVEIMKSGITCITGTYM